MLEVKNLVKCYSTKGGVTVKALDDVSVKFPETGMVFLLGRSGSGKSTLLNVSGGLDKPDSGEIIVKGRSSKDFSTADFDSYRNTYVGFVFQEYNILNEFTVEQNIALALQLQSKPNDKKAVNDLLEKVDLKGLGKRKPNTLSGGQKQRVAIARALIKEPEIIMADEPTGALDSNTGKQVLDTLKKLSETKLVVVVSHDREFAEQYGDRIIELKDGKILTDVSKAYSSPKQLNQNVQIVSEDTISIRNAEDITEADVKSIVDMLKKNKGEAIITAGKKEMTDVKRACKINESGNKEYFKDTEEVKIKEYDGKKTKFIKSKLPTSHAFKMGASGLKTKPIRLIFTIFLSVVAFLMFGVVSTFMLYDPNYSVSEALQLADYPSLTVSKYYTAVYQSIKVNNQTGEETVDYEHEQEYSTLFGVQELIDKNAMGQGDFAGIFNFTNDKYNSAMTYGIMLVNGDGFVEPNIESKSKLYYPVTEIYGFTDCGADYMTRNGFSFVGEGRYPESKSEIAIPEYVAKLFVNTEGSGVTEVSQMLGKKIKLSGCNAIGNNVSFTVVGIYNVGSVPAKYDEIKDSTSNNISATEKESLQKSLADFLACNFNSILYVTPDFYDEYKDNMTNNNGVHVDSEYVQGIRITDFEITDDYVEWGGASVYTEKTVSDYASSFKFYDLSGNLNPTAFTLTANQIYLPLNKYINAKREIVRLYAEKMYNMTYNSIYYVPEAGAAMADGTDFYTAYNDIWSIDDLSPLTDVIDQYYTTLAEREYVFKAAQKMVNKSSSKDDDKYTQGEFKESFDRISAYFNDHDNNPTMQNSDWETLKTAVFSEEDGFKTYCPQAYYYDYAYEMNDRLFWGEFESIRLAIEEELGTTFDSIYYSLNWEGLSEGDFIKIKSVIDNYYDDVMGHNMQEPDFSVDYSVELKAFYQNYLNQKGEFTVVGFFENTGNGYAEYLVHTDFLNEYREMRDGMGDENTWKSKEKTDYVAPTDAKFNFLVSLTDNTQEQIANALAGGDSVVVKINNSLYAQLDMFLSTITEMQDIFLIIGAVLGVFAALMLLNFISVSITAKRKDIGILRAVGARGSDVFKIFFAEAFIIAVICFVLATIGAYVVCDVLNTSLVSMVSMKLLNFQLVNVALILGVSFGISTLATFFPVYFASKKSPVESIRAL